MRAMLTKPRSKLHAIDISEKSGVRYLHFGSDWVQGAMRISRPWALELAYTREMMAGLLLRPQAGWPRRALMVGLGAGSQARFIYRHLPACRITAVEINPQVEWIARQYFNLPDDPRRLQVVIEDGADYMLRGDEPFDLILCDGFDPDARSGALDTPPFYQACRARLSERGLLSVNLLGRNAGWQGSAERLRQAFDGRSLVFPPCDSGNTVVFAAAGEPVEISLENLEQRAAALKESCTLDLLPTLRRLRQEIAFPDGLLRL